ncbi:MAG: TRAP transporter small permease [Sphingomonadales bacterium]|nr:TRAP transporter small permease [Sphingomonadales bacterium]
MLDKLLGGAHALSRAATWIGGAMMMATAFAVTFDVVVRKVAGFSLEGADELSGYAFAISTAWAFSLGLLQRANVRIDGIYLLAPTGIRAVLDFVALAALSLFLACLLWSGWYMWLDSYQYDARSITSWRTPLAYPQAAWLLGWLWFAVVVVLVFLRCLQAAIQGRLEDVVAVAGVRTLQEEVDAEIRHASDKVLHERQHPRGSN